MGVGGRLSRHPPLQDASQDVHPGDIAVRWTRPPALQVLSSMTLSETKEGRVGSCPHITNSVTVMPTYTWQIERIQVRFSPVLRLAEIDSIVQYTSTSMVNQTAINAGEQLLRYPMTQTQTTSESVFMTSEISAEALIWRERYSFWKSNRGA